MPEPSSPAAATTRLNKRMAELGLCSRREADDWIARGWVRVNGQTAVMGLQVAPDARIEVDTQAKGQQQRQVTILLHKPIGYVSGQAEDGHQPAVMLVQQRNHWSGDASRLRSRRSSCAAWRPPAAWTSTPPACWCSRRTAASRAS
jgi:23S rRNA pseudouridine2604 synthase